MKRLALVLAAVTSTLSLAAWSQQLQQPVVPAAPPAKPPINSGVGPKLGQPASTQVPAIASDPNQRQASSAAISSTGPAKEVPIGSAPPARQKPTSVLDANGRPVDGTIQVAPNRVYDPATGKYRWTEASGKEQKMLDPTK